MTDHLTYPMVRSYSNRLETYGNRLEALIASLPTPTDYFSGYSCFLPLLPHDVLAFKRSREYLDRETTAFHHRFVFILPVQGEGGVILDGQMCMLTPGHGMLIFPYQSHYFARLSGTRFHWLFLTFALDEFSPLLPLRNNLIPLTLAAIERSNEIMRLYMQACQGNKRSAEAIALHVSLLLHDLLAAHAVHPKKISSVTELVDEKHGLAGKASQYVYRNTAIPLSPNDVAQELDISESHLRAVFRQTVGVSLGKFIRQAKIFKACTLLRTTSLLVTDIATECGYESLYAFSRAFSKIMKVSPQQYRKQMTDGMLNANSVP